MKNDCEIWKQTFVFPNSYEVSSFGNVRSIDRFIKHNTAKTGMRFIKGITLKMQENHKGYYMVSLSNDNIQKTVAVHRLVALAFLENPNNYNQVNHIDGNKHNNNVENLEWCNNSMNQIHAYKYGLRKHTDKSGREKVNVIQYSEDGSKIISKYDSIAEASRKTGISQTAIRKAVMKITKKFTTCGFHWEIGKEGDA